MLANWGLMSNLYHAASWSLLGLKLEKDSSKMKAVNSEARPSVGLAKGVSIRIRSWAGTTILMALPMMISKSYEGWNSCTLFELSPCPS
ncbi:hypothetical protein AAC387_Pa12g0699 [Persea americana]